MTRLEHRGRTSFGAVIFLVGVVFALALGGCGDKKKGLRIENIEPKTGPIHGGSQVTIHGSGFQSAGATAVNVYFGKRSARVIAFEGDSKLLVEPPPGRKGETVDVMLVFGDGRPFTYEKAYTYVDLTEGFGVGELKGDKPEE